MDTLRKLTAACLAIIFSLQVLAGDNHSSQPDNKTIRKADNLFIFGDYKNALPIYEKLVGLSPENAQFNYRLGVCYYYSGNDILKCLPHFENAKKNFTDENAEAIDLYYYLGTTYHMLNRFDKAIECYTRLKSFILPDKQGQQDLLDLDNQIAACNKGKELIQKPFNVRISDLGSNVNSEYADYAPVVSNDGSMLMFTSKRKESTGGRMDEEGNYYEDVFISKRINEEDEWQRSERLDSSENVKRISIPFLFSKSKALGNSINTKEHDASVALSPDGKHLYIYRLDDVWVSDYKNDKWGKPSRLNNFISSKKNHEPSLSLSMDEKTLYFVSEREGGFGGKDIYKSEKQNDGSWGQPVNLGPVINTEFDEDAPFIDPENKTLYFSSEAHGSMGGFDIFRSAFENNAWSAPVNLGYPVNSGANDIFYVYNSKNKTAYFSSLREGGKGNYDIYLADYGMKKIPVRPAITMNNKSSAAPGLIEIRDPGQNESQKISAGDEHTYTAGESYSMTITSPSGEKHNSSFTVPPQATEEEFYQEIAYEEIRGSDGKLKGYLTTLYNVFFNLDSAIRNTVFAKNTNKKEAYSAYLKSIKDFKHPGLIVSSHEESLPENSVMPLPASIQIASILFDYDKNELNPKAETELQKAYHSLRDNNSLNLKIIGYADSKGSEDYNKKLSEKRALKAKKYLVHKGIDGSRIEHQGNGESNPVAPNENADGSDNPEGRKLNRRVEFLLSESNLR